MATLESLTAQLPNNLEALLMDPAAMQAYENSLVDRASGDIERQAGNEAQRINESAFGRGMGLSSINAFAQAQNMRARDEALAKARIDANTAAQQAARAAVGQAASYVTAQNAQHQQASQFDRQMKQQKSLANQQMIMGGLGGLAGGLAKGAGAMFAPEIKKGIKGMIGGDGQPQGGASSLPYGANNYQQPEWMSKPLEANPDAINASVSMPDMQEPSGGGGLSDLAFDFGDLSGAGGGSQFTIDPSSFDFGNFDSSDLWSLMNNDWSF